MKKRILVVDDSPSVRQMICFTLTGAGFDTDEAGDGQQALTKAQSGAYNMVFTDQNSRCRVQPQTRPASR